MIKFPFSKKPQKPESPKYHKITCLSLTCMREFEHYEMMFQLEPPKEVVNYRQQKLIDSSMSVQPSTADLPKPRTQAKGDFAISDDDDENNQNITDGDFENNENVTETSNIKNTVSAETKRLDEMVEYYYSDTPQFGYEYGGGTADKPNYIKITAAQAQKTGGKTFPCSAYREYYGNDPATQYVVSIIDSYGNKTQNAVCPYCYTPLFSSMAGTYETFVLPVIGVSKSGKTVLLNNSFRSFINDTVPKMLPRGSYFESPEMQKYLNIINERLKPKVDEENEELAATKGYQLLFAEIESVDRKILMCTYDLSGELIANIDNTEFRQTELSKLLQRANGMIIIVCPEQIKGITRLDLNAVNQGDNPVQAFSEMIRLLSLDADRAGIVKKKNLPICLVLTMIDLFGFENGTNYRIDISQADAEVHKMLYEGENNRSGIISRKEITTLNEALDVVNMGEIDKYAQQTEKLFEKIIASEYNAILNRFAGQKQNVRCFAMSSQGNDIKDNQLRPPIRPKEVFYWLFAMMGIYKKPEISSKPKGQK